MTNKRSTKFIVIQRSNMAKRCWQKSQPYVMLNWSNTFHNVSSKNPTNFPFLQNDDGMEHTGNLGSFFRLKVDYFTFW